MISSETTRNLLGAGLENSGDETQVLAGAALGSKAAGCFVLVPEPTKQPLVELRGEVSVGRHRGRQRPTSKGERGKREAGAVSRRSKAI